MEDRMITHWDITPEEIERIQEESELLGGKYLHSSTGKLIAAIRRILKEQNQFGLITVRQLYYQLVVRKIIENTRNDYAGFNTHLTKARKCGLIDWEDFEDRSRTDRKEPLPRLLAAIKKIPVLVEVVPRS